MQCVNKQNPKFEKQLLDIYELYNSYIKHIIIIENYTIYISNTT